MSVSRNSAFPPPFKTVAANNISTLSSFLSFLQLIRKNNVASAKTVILNILLRDFFVFCSIVC
ncbi:hypothetical protein CH378_06445 [Leptospira kmetyi]|uniref:Uncharacterized protein n=1 Tax=Leptospira kmetyi TaxID=408139 RepID=A0ABX4NF09_9LEPT|nr:hypothetical protein CH378_06445 [Leptospira kmetyi]